MKHLVAIASACTLVAVSACHRVTVAQEELSRRVTVSACPPGVEAASSTDTLPSASLRVELTFDPAMAAGTEIPLRLDGETTRSTIRVDATQPIGFTLAKGVYVVRVQPQGYTGLEARVPLTAGCTATVTMLLKRDVAK